MESKLSQMLLMALLGCSATAAAAAAAAPAVTPAPLVVRAVTTVGYMSTGTARGTTLWVPITLNGESLIVATSGSIYRLCDPSLSCEFFSCRGSYAVFPSSSISCGGASTCSSYILASDIYDQSPLTNYWCDSNTKTGGTIYRTTPGATVTATPRTTSAPTPTPTSTAPPETIVSPGPSPSPAPKSSTPIGAIVGGVIGGIAVLGAVVVGVIFLLRRKRNSSSAPAQGSAQYHQPQPMAQPPNQPPGVGYYNPNPQGYPPEKTPAATQANPYYHSDNSGPASPAPQYMPPMNTMPPANTTREINELPAQRM